MKGKELANALMYMYSRHWKCKCGANLKKIRRHDEGDYLAIRILTVLYELEQLL